VVQRALVLLSSRFERQAAAAPVASLGISAAAKYSGIALISTIVARQI